MLPSRVIRRTCEKAQRSIESSIVAVLVFVATAAFAQIGEQVDAAFLGYTDWEGAKTYAWQAGTPALDPGFERLAHTQIEKRLSAKGWTKTSGEADLHVRSDVVRTLSQMIVAFRVDVLDADSGELVWRGMATGVRASTRKQNEKAIRRVIKRMFKEFPRAAE